MAAENDIDIRIRSTDETAQGLGSATRSASSFRDTLRSVGTTAAGVLTADLAVRAAEGFKTFVTSSITAASDLNESLNAVSVTFQSSSKEVLDWGANSAASFGLSQKAFNEMATPLGAMLKNAGFSLQDTSKWTIDLTKRASDMASVFNTDVTEALEAIQAGLRGESDPLEKYGVGLSAAKVEAQALADTGKSTAKSLTDQELATGRLNLIMKQTSSTAGDFTSTSDGLANASRVAAAEWENAKASLGSSLLPVMAKAATVAVTMAQGFNGLPDGIKTTIVVVGVLGTAFAMLGPKILAAKAAVAEWGITTRIAESRAAPLAAGLGKVAAGFIAAQAASAAMNRDASVGVKQARTEIEKFIDTGTKTGDLTKKISDDLASAFGGGRIFSGFQEGFQKAVEGIGLGGLELGDSLENSRQRLSSWDAALADMASNGNAAKAAEMFQALTDRVKENGGSVDEMKNAFPQYAAALDEAAKATGGAAKASDGLVKSLKDQRDEIDKASNALLDGRDAARGLEEAYDNASEALKTNGKTLDISTSKGRANQTALDNIAISAYSARDAITAQGGSQEKANAVMATARTRFVAAATAMGMSKTQAQNLANQLFAIPKTVNSTVNLNTATAAARLATLRSSLFQIQGLAMQINSGSYGAGLGFMKATGGIVGRAASGGMRSNMVMTGENGPELLELPPGTSVKSNPDTERMMMGAGSGSSQVVLELRSSGNRVDDLLLEVLRLAIRVRGGNVQTVLGS